MTLRFALMLAALVFLMPPSMAKAKSLSTAEFVQQAEMSGEFEIGSSRLAEDKAQNQAVKDFAAMMIKDHTDASQKLRAAAKVAGLPEESATKLDEKHAKKMKDLEQAKPAAFDKLYVEQQRKAHEEAVALFKRFAESSAKDNAVKQFAKETLPTLETHLERVKSLNVPST